MQRRTRQSEAIRSVLAEADRPLSPQEILDAARRAIPALGLATVYRHIRSLSESGWLHAVDLPGAPSRYEVAGKHHHHHFHCRRCDRVFEVEDCPGNLRDLAPRGFQPEGHEIILYGLCRTCASRSPGARPATGGGHGRP